LTNEAVLDEAENLGARIGNFFLDAQQNESLIAIAESIVPVDKAGERFIDLLLSVDADKQRKSLWRLRRSKESTEAIRGELLLPG